MVFRPLARCGLFRESAMPITKIQKFPSPCGVWVVSYRVNLSLLIRAGFRPLAGCGLFRIIYIRYREGSGFRPLAGGGLFPGGVSVSAARAVSVPLRGVGCFDIVCYFHNLKLFPSPCGVWVVSYDWHHKLTGSCGFRPLAGCGLFLVYTEMILINTKFPSPCGVWVVSY